MKLPVSAPPEIVHDGEPSKLLGFDARRHVVPTQFAPVAKTPVPARPLVGLKPNVGAGGMVNVADPKSPVLPVTVTVYVPLATPATMKEPDIKPPAMAQVGPAETRPGGVEDNVQPVSAAAKPEPVTSTLIPARPTVGTSAIAAVTVNGALPKSPVAPLILTVLGPFVAVGSTVKEPVTVPSGAIEHVNAVISMAEDPAGVHGGPASPMAKPEPPTAMTADRGPKFGVRVTTRGITFSVALAENAGAAVSVTLMVSLSPTNNGLRTNSAAAVNKKAPSMQPPTTTEPPVTDGGTAADDIVHVPKAVAKLLPVMLTVAPRRAGLGDNVCEIWGTTEKGAVRPSPVLPVSNSVFTSAPLPARTTTNEPVTTPPETLHEGGGTAAIVFPSPSVGCVRLQVASPVLNPLALKWIVSSPLPLFGENVSMGTVTVKEADTVVCGTRAALEIPNVCSPATAALLT